MPIDEVRTGTEEDKVILVIDDPLEKMWEDYMEGKVKQPGGMRKIGADPTKRSPDWKENPNYDADKCKQAYKFKLRYCKNPNENPTGCAKLNTDDCDEYWRRATNADICKWAREQEMSYCDPADDDPHNEGHKKAAEQTGTAAKTCREKAKECEEKRSLKKASSSLRCRYGA